MIGGVVIPPAYLEGVYSLPVELLLSLYSEIYQKDIYKC